MKTKVTASILGLAIGLSGLVSAPARAAVAIDPATGWDGWFRWDGTTGPIDGIQTSGGLFSPTFGTDTTWSLNLASDSVLSRIHVQDDFAPGDQFELVVDGLTVSWTSTYTGSGMINTTETDLFYADLENLALSAGAHTFSLNVTQTNPEIEGNAYIAYSSTTPVPGPATALLMLAGLASLGWLGRRR